MEKLIIIAVSHKISEGILFPKDLEHSDMSIALVIKSLNKFINKR